MGKTSPNTRLAVRLVPVSVLSWHGAVAGKEKPLNFFEKPQSFFGFSLDFF